MRLRKRAEVAGSRAPEANIRAASAFQKAAYAGRVEPDARLPVASRFQALQRVRGHRVATEGRDAVRAEPRAQAAGELPLR